jgi:hypothetical protein
MLKRPRWCGFNAGIRHQEKVLVVKVLAVLGGYLVLPNGWLQMAGFDINQYISAVR